MWQFHQTDETISNLIVFSASPAGARRRRFQVHAVVKFDFPKEETFGLRLVVFH
jgi:hypothetical protein